MGRIEDFTGSPRESDWREHNREMARKADMIYKASYLFLLGIKHVSSPSNTEEGAKRLEAMAKVVADNIINDNLSLTDALFVATTAVIFVHEKAIEADSKDEDYRPDCDNCPAKDECNLPIKKLSNGMGHVDPSLN